MAYRLHMAHIAHERGENLRVGLTAKTGSTETPKDAFQ